MIDFTLVALDEIDSTNEEAKRRIAAGTVKEGLVIAAVRQSAGKGRHGRSWSSPEGNTYFSLLLKAFDPAANSQLSFVAALAVADAIDAFAGEKLAQLKWPNDVLARDKKLSGILIEAEGDWLILGIGVNVGSAPETAIYPATSLAALGVHTTANEMREQILENFSLRLENYKSAGFAVTRAAWMERGWRMHQAALIRDNENEARGVFIGLDEIGRCRLQTADGIRCFSSGSFFAPSAGAEAA